MKSVRQIASELFPGKMIKAKEAKVCPSFPVYDVWVKEDNASRGKHVGQIAFLNGFASPVFNAGAR